MMLIIIFRRSGITRNAELYWPFKGDITAEGALKRHS